MARDIARFLRSEEQHRIREFFQRPQAIQHVGLCSMRDMLRHFRGRAGRSSQRRHERAGCDAIHIDAVRAELTRQRLCELDYPRLGRRVGRAARRGPRRIVRRRAGAERRRDVDDLSGLVFVTGPSLT